MPANTNFCIDILCTFEEKELKKFRDFVSCRYFNADKYVIHLLKILERKIILDKRTFDADMKDIIREELFEERSPKDKNENKYEKLKKENALFNTKMNMLQKLAENFLAIQTMESNETLKYELLYPQLLERKLFKLFERHANKSRKLLDKQTIKAAEDYGQIYRTELKFYEFLFVNNRLGKEDNFSKMIYHLDIYYIISNLHIRLPALALKTKVKTKKYNFPPMKRLDSLIQYPKYAKHPIIMLYLASIDLQQSKTQKAYRKLQNLLINNTNIIPEKLLKGFYTIAISHCTRKIREGGVEYRKNMFDLYQTMHEHGLMLEDGIILPNQLKNMITIGCKEKEFQWTEDITNYYRPFVLKSIRESVYNYNLGVIAFYQKKYDLAHERFIQVHDVSLIYDINVRVMILKCYYEKARLKKDDKDYNENIVGTMRVTKAYFKNKKELSISKRRGYKNFVQILIYLYRLLHQEGKMTLKRIKEKLDEQKVNEDKQWLLEKIAELEKRR